MRFRINLATKIYIDTRRLKFWTVAAVVLLVSLLFLNLRSISVKTGEIRQLENQIAAYDDKFKTASKKEVPEKEYNELLARIDFANSVIEKKTYNWLELLDRLERVVPDGIAVSSIEPDPKGQGLKLAGTARSFTNLRVFMEQLEDSKFFTETYLVTQGETKLDDTMKAITFNLTCKVMKK